jgi:hypothetical protein
VRGATRHHIIKSKVVYRFDIFGRYLVGISPVLPIPYRRKTRSAHFGIKKGAVPPFFLKRGAMAPFLRSFGKKGGGKGGSIQKRGERYRPKYRKSSKSDTSKIPIPKKLLVAPWYTTLIKSKSHLGRCLQRTHFFFHFFPPKLTYVRFVMARDHLGKLVMEK